MLDLDWFKFLVNKSLAKIGLAVSLSLVFSVSCSKKNNNNSGYIIFENGLMVKTLSEGKGRKIDLGDVVVVNYVGKLEDGTVFDSSYERGYPIKYKVGESGYIEGWKLGIIGMKVDEKREIIIPPSLGYGERAMPDIPPNSKLIFEVKIEEIVN